MSLVQVLLVDALCCILEQNTSSSLLSTGSTRKTDITEIVLIYKSILYWFSQRECPDMTVIVLVECKSAQTKYLKRYSVCDYKRNCSYKVFFCLI